jgi:hypothetical protein
MRLLNTKSWEMREFITEEDVPPYAILSHTWGDEEINFQQWENRDVLDLSQEEGYEKITEFGNLADSDGYDWVWVDT